MGGIEGHLISQNDVALRRGAQLSKCVRSRIWIPLNRVAKSPEATAMHIRMHVCMLTNSERWSDNIGLREQASGLGPEIQTGCCRQSPHSLRRTWVCFREINLGVVFGMHGPRRVQKQGDPLKDYGLI